MGKDKEFEVEGSDLEASHQWNDNYKLEKGSFPSVLVHFRENSEKKQPKMKGQRSFQFSLMKNEIRKRFQTCKHVSQLLVL